jgi:hypothetical protein
VLAPGPSFDGHKVLVLGPLASFASGLRSGGYIDLAATDFGSKPPEPGRRSFLELDGQLESAHLPAVVTRLASDSSATVLLLARVDPLPRLAAAARERWTRVLRGFEVKRGRVESDGTLENCGKATAIFYDRWTASTEDERRTLAQIAIDGHPSPHPAVAPVLEQLCARGLLDATTLAIVSEPFADFVRSAASQPEFDVWAETDAEETPWTLLRAPLTTGVTALLVILNSSHLEFAATGALVPTIAAALPAVLKLLTAPPSSA